MDSPPPILDRLRTKGAYFFLNEFAETIHLSTCIAEGFDELGIPIFADRTVYERPYGGGFLFRASGNPSSAGVVIIDVSHIDRVPFDRRVAAMKQIENLLSSGLRPVVLCNADNVNFTPFPPDILALIATHGSSLIHMDDRIPWAFGLNRATITALDRLDIDAPRSRSFVRNFRPSMNQDVRNALDLAFVKSLETHFSIDVETEPPGMRGTDSHLKRLAISFGCLAYGGFFVPNLSTAAERPFWWRSDLLDSKWPVIGRWDSWRFWESLAAGCLTISLDFEEYGFLAPVVPQNGRHYLGLRLHDLNSAVTFLRSADPEHLREIRIAGRAWVLEHYSPKAVALRFIATLSDRSGRPSNPQD